MALLIPTNALPSQVFSTQISGENIRFDIYQRSTGLYANIWLNNSLVVAGAICRNATFIARNKYLGLPGDFAFIDIQGSSDPTYDGLGARYFLICEAH